MPGALAPGQGCANRHGSFGRAWSSEEIARQYPHLSLSEIHSALAYYFDHQEQIDSEIHDELRRANLSAATARQSPFAIRLAALAR